MKVTDKGNRKMVHIFRELVEDSSCVLSGPPGRDLAAASTSLHELERSVFLALTPD